MWAISGIVERNRKLNTKRGSDDGKNKPSFAHHSESEFARILDFYQIEWQYEPRTFHLQGDEKGNPTESFAPDFYLPEFELFIELTTLRQSLVTKKNRKLRRLRELYPDINIKLFYNRDFKSLMAKYGLPVTAGPEKRAVKDVGTVVSTTAGEEVASTVEATDGEEERLSPE